MENKLNTMLGFLVENKLTREEKLSLVFSNPEYFSTDNSMFLIDVTILILANQIYSVLNISTGK